ncbi:beta-ketoacyl synthase N-terminal-like domain-containing protein [Flavobacterium sp. T12S277]|uniref:beta-ketoacyl synthase N-terminal-like domain-containing protein n=1 Tax=Flavobacterium sp. T12S277 TaxID=3402752 RepID=UPI003AEC88FB
MVPGALVVMDSFPLTINGKLDKRSLPDPDFSSSSEDYTAPRTELERSICSIWEEVLGLDRVGVTDNFFKIGGNSILCIQLKQNLNKLKEFKDIGIADLFKNDTIAKLISSIDNHKQTNYKLQNSIGKNRNHEIAIIGVSGEFSGVKNLDDYWQLIINQKEGLQFFTKEECKDIGIKETLLENENYLPVAGLIEDIELFDPLFWGISPNEAKQLDPQIRKFIEHCWFALEASGYGNNHKDFITGVIGGSGSNDYYYNHILKGEMADEINVWDVAASNSKDALTTKTAFFLGLSGPANSINTACSTSLVSVVEGCQKLQLGICDMVLAGGVSLLLPDQIGYIYNEGMILSKDGHCRTFDADASGTIGGSGVGVVLLKRLEDAIKDNDNIIGVIKGYATNNDGDRKIGYTAPSIIGQSECIINAQINAGITSDEVDYVECHGTGTNIGDPIEIQALREAFTYNIDKKKKIDKNTILGSVKANIGHTNSAAGIAGLLKVCSMLKNSEIPGQTNFNIINPELYLNKTTFSINTKNKEWIANSNRQRIAGVSSFGIGGTNAHLIIGDYIYDKEKSIKIKNNQFILDNKCVTQNYIILFSAKSRKSLENHKQLFIEYLKGINKDDDVENIKNIAFTLQEKRKHFEYRSAYRVTSKQELISKLNVDLSYIQTTAEENSKIVFMFPGQGAQYTQMAKGLYDNEPQIKCIIDKCIDLANKFLAIDLYQVIYPLENILNYDINEIQFTPISLFIIEYSLAKYLEYLGVHADAYIGHSFGEYVAATLAGVFDLEDAIKIVIVRSKLMQLMEPGSMLSVNAEEHVIKEIVESFNCEIAVINSVEDIVISGTIIGIEKLQKTLEKQNIPVVRLKTSHAGHSKMMEKAAKEFEKEFKQIKLNRPNKVFVSNLTGEIATDEVSTAAYWCRHLRNTVLFSKGIDRLSKEYNYQVSFIEVGVGKGLSSFVNKYKNANKYKKIQSLQLLPSSKEVNESDEYYQKIEFGEDIKAKLWISGIIDNPNDVKLFNEAKLITDIPRYQFDYQDCWIKKGDLPNAKTFNSLENICYERSWERSDVIKQNKDFSKNIKYKNILILINEKILEDETYELLNLLRDNYDNTNYAIHQLSNDIDADFIFDFNNKSHISKILDKKNNIDEIDLIIYISSSIDVMNPALDIFALKNVFEWSKQTSIKIPKIISISFDNYEVVGSELLKERPSIVYGVTKSIPYEYFTSNTKTFHIDLSSKDYNYKDYLLSILEQNKENELVVIRGKYFWTPTYKKAKIIDVKDKICNQSSAFLITGGLGALGYAYAKHLSNNHNQCTLILIGRTIEANLREDYKNRLAVLRQTKHNIIYSAIDIGDSEATNVLKDILKINCISNINVVLHTAVTVAQSALNNKTHNDIEQVLNPKVIGIENLLKLAKFVPINNLVSCSSLTSIMPSLGNMEYTAANLYLDEISYRKHSNVDSILSVNINQISDAGAALEFIENSVTKSGKTSNSILSKEFPVILENLLVANHQKNICISRFDIQIGFTNYFKFLDFQKNKNETLGNIKLIETDFSDIEYNIAKIFGEVLGLEEISVQDDFFKIGGNSISAIKVSHLMSQAFECDIWVSDLFKHRTIENLKEILFNTTKIKGEVWEI